MEGNEFDEQVRLEFYRSNVQATREVGVMALRTLITLNSGAFVVLLTFIGNAEAQSQFVVPLDQLKLAMMSFLIGLAAAFTSIAYTYVASQSASPYPQSERRTDGWYVPIVVIVTAVSFLAFLFGVLTIVNSVQAI